MAPRKGRMTQVRPRGPTLHFGLNPETVLLKRTPTWNRLTRPRRSQIIEWGGLGDATLTFDLIFDRLGARKSVEHHIRLLNAWQIPTGEGKAPPKVRFHYGGMGRHSLWVVDDISEAQEYRRHDLTRIYYEASVTLLRYAHADAHTPSEKHKGNRPHAAATVATSYVVHAGDTLSAIAARQLGDVARWKEIADLNQIRDPRNLRVGDRLKVPS